MIPMITNGGPHPADKWADTTTETILGLIQVSEGSETPEAAAARTAKRELRSILFGLFLEHHDAVQRAERIDLAEIKKHEQAREHLTRATTMYRERGMTYWREKAEAER